MSESMLEIVARAINQARWEDDQFAIPWEAAGRHDQQYALRMAKAALEAVAADPDDAMLRAFYEAGHPPGESPIGGFSTWATWDQSRSLVGPEIKKGLAAMIQAALTSQTETPDRNS